MEVSAAMSSVLSWLLGQDGKELDPNENTHVGGTQLIKSSGSDRVLS